GWAGRLEGASSSSGVERATNRLSSPPADATTRQPGTEPPRRCSRHQPNAYAPATTSRGATTSGRVLQTLEVSAVKDQTSPGGAAPIGGTAPWATAATSRGGGGAPRKKRAQGPRGKPRNAS